MAVFFFADTGSFQRQRFGSDAEDFGDTLQRQVHLTGNFFQGRFAAQAVCSRWLLVLTRRLMVSTM